MTATLDNAVADLRRANAELQRRLDEALAERDEGEAQKAAMAEVLEVINASAGDLAPVFDAMLDKAMRICEAAFGGLFTYDGEFYRSAAQRNLPAALLDAASSPIRAQSAGGALTAVANGEHLIHIADIIDTEDYRAGVWSRRLLADAGGARTALWVALRKDDVLRGLFVLYRTEVRPFTGKEIALVRNFAAQAVIAIENARLLGELRERTDDLTESLEYQTATSDVLKVISRSTFDLQPVLDALCEAAVRLCNADIGQITNREGDAYRMAATFTASPEFAAFGTVMRGRLLKADRSTLAGRTALEGQVVQIADITADPEYAVAESASVGKLRTVMGVPLLREGLVAGTIQLGRTRVEPFTERQVELVRTFADQAVIAIENTRLITETREALEQQTATAEVLGVINDSPGDLAPVFEAMLDKATRLCDAALGVLSTVDDSGQVKHVAFSGPSEVEKVLRARPPVRPGSGTTMARLIKGEDFIQVLDATAEEVYRRGDPGRTAMVDLAKARTIIGIALRTGDALIGAITLYRQEVRPFTEKEIALLQNFAAQAVIAMENARLITETQEALEQQTATAEVLGVINSSPGDLAPVFDVIVEKARRVCGAAFGVLRTFDGEAFHLGAVHGGTAEQIARLRELPPLKPLSFSANGPWARLARGEPIVHIADMREIAGYRASAQVRELIDLRDIRTWLGVSLVRDNVVLGAIVVHRQEVRLFSEREIKLIRSFADQAVIAMENARLITETREALEQQTATAEVLGVINASPGDLSPVFDAILEKAHCLCGAVYGSVQTFNGDQFRAVAVRGLPEAFAERLREGFRPDPANPIGRLLQGDRYIHIPDMAASPGSIVAEAVRTAGMRTLLSVPLRKEGQLLGQIVAAREEVRPFSEKEIALLENFAAQAVIAMENARLITETQEALDQQTATAEVLGVINSSPGDLAPVFDAMLEKAMRLCDAQFGGITHFDGQDFPVAALRGVSPELAQKFREPLSGRAGSYHHRLVRGETVVHLPNLAAEEISLSAQPHARALADTGTRTLLLIALRKDGALLGSMWFYRLQVLPFTDKQIALLQNFAAQAVIAIENARLITETREALDQQTATAEVLGVINSSPGDLAPVFDTMLEKAMRLCEAAFGTLTTFENERWTMVAERGLPRPYVEYLSEGTQPGSTGTHSRILAGATFAHVNDLMDEEPYRSGAPARRALVDLGGARTALTMPLRKDSVVLGAFTIYRQEVRPFTDKQIVLLQSFAAQAVIAMENARLITETREALDQQTATAEVLQVINASPGDLQPVFDAMLEKAKRLCDAGTAHLLRYADGNFSRMASLGVTEDFDKLLPLGQPVPHIITRDSVPYRTLATRSPINIPELRDDDSYRAGAPAEVAAVNEAGVRSILFVPLLKEGDVIGTFVMHRQEVRPFSDKQIALLQNFAAQAVIAMENARLLDEIRQRQAELGVTFDNMADGVVMFDEDLRLAAWNRNFQELLDLPDEALTERPSYASYLRILAERGEFGTEGIEAELNRRLEDTEHELRLERTRPDGTVIEVRRNAVPDGGFVLIYSDITERKRSEAEIRTARDAAEATLRDLRAAQANLIQAEKMASLGQLTAGIAHEIKNPLNFVNNFASLSVELLDELKETTAPAIAAFGGDTRVEVDETMEMLTSNLEKIAEHGKRADNIVKSMLEHSRGVTGERREVDLNNLIEEALNLAYHGARAQDQNFNITLEREYGTFLKPIELAPQEITRVFLNLFGNGFYAANKRSHENGNGSFRPSLTVATRDTGDAVEVRVRDNGTGIPPEIKDKLFQPFFTTKPTGEGTGLGLSISYDIVTQQHGGTIEVDSRVGEFTEFTIRLPRGVAQTGASA